MTRSSSITNDSITTTKEINSKSTKKEKRKVPRRPFGSKYNNPRLPKDCPIIGLGASSFSNFFSDDQEESLSLETLSPNHPRVQKWIETIQYAVHECGITYIDTAPWYGHGMSEIVLGFAIPLLLQKHDRSDLIINTKVGRYEAEPIRQFDFSYNTTIQSVQRSLERMKCQYIDVLQLHDPEFSPCISILLEETIPAMIHSRDELGYAKALGITGYPLEIQHEILIRTSSLSEKGSCGVIFDLSLTYSHFNLHDCSLFVKPLLLENNNTSTAAIGEGNKPVESSKDYTPSFAEYCWSKSIVVMNAAPLSMGLLTATDPPEWHPAPYELKEACRQARDLCDGGSANLNSSSQISHDEKEGNSSLNLARIATIFALSQKNVPCTLIGMSSIFEVDRAVEAAMLFVDEEDSYDSQELKKQLSTATDITLSPSNSSLSVLSRDQIEKRNWAKLKAEMAPNLRNALSNKEMMFLTHVQDEECGPFANIWKQGLNEWDGIEIANEFWSSIPGKEEAIERMKRRV